MTANTRDRVIRSRRVIVGGQVRSASIVLRDGAIAAIEAYGIPSSADDLDFGNAVIMPGIVDTHVHINEPGRTEWEGFATATRAAAAGGVTTLIEMPLNSIPPTTTVEAFLQKTTAAEGKLAVDVGFWGGVVGSNAAELEALYSAGVFGFKCFLVPSGVPQFDSVGERELREALPVLARLNAVLLVHSELPGPIEAVAAELETRDPRRYETWLRSRPRSAENEAIALLIRLGCEYGARLHVVHLSSCDAIACLARARAEGVRISVETCPHYLWFAAEDVPDGATEFKCAPPIRERENREQLWRGLAEGTVDFVATDHSPCPPEMKCSATGNLMQAWGGIASLQLTLAVMWTAAQRRGFDLPMLARWLCEGPARLAGLQKKGKIAPGFDADLVVWEPESTFEVVPSALHHRHKITPYAGQVLSGKTVATVLRGQPVYERGVFPAKSRGRVLRRGEA